MCSIADECGHILLSKQTDLLREVVVGAMFTFSFHIHWSLGSRPICSPQLRFDAQIYCPSGAVMVLCWLHCLLDFLISDFCRSKNFSLVSHVSVVSMMYLRVCITVNNNAKMCTF